MIAKDLPRSISSRSSWRDAFKTFGKRPSAEVGTWSLLGQWAAGRLGTLDGRGGKTVKYAADSLELRSFRDSPPADRLREAFRANGYQTTTGISFGTSESAMTTAAPRFLQGLALGGGNPGLALTYAFSDTPAQVGGYAGGEASNLGDGRVEYNVRNTMGVWSLSYHLLSDRRATSGMFTNVVQDFTWVEPHEAHRADPVGSCP